MGSSVCEWDPLCAQLLNTSTTELCAAQHWRMGRMGRMGRRLWVGWVGSRGGIDLSGCRSCHQRSQFPLLQRLTMHCTALQGGNRTTSDASGADSSPRKPSERYPSPAHTRTFTSALTRGSVVATRPDHSGSSLLIRWLCFALRRTTLHCTTLYPTAQAETHTCGLPRSLPRVQQTAL